MSRVTEKMLRCNINILVETLRRKLVMSLLKWIKSLFSEQSYQDSLDYFITSKRPTSTAEVEYWTRYYDQHVSIRNSI